MSEEDYEIKGSAIKGVAIGFALQLPAILLMFGAAFGHDRAVLWVILLADLAIIVWFSRHWRRLGHSTTMSGFLVVITISAMVLVPCWRTLLSN